jgi:hypothetical protein
VKKNKKEKCTLPHLDLSSTSATIKDARDVEVMKHIDHMRG